MPGAGLNGGDAPRRHIIVSDSVLVGSGNDEDPSRLVCIIEHDTALFSSLDGLLAGIRERRWDVVGMEKRVRDGPATAATLPSTHGRWLRYDHAGAARRVAGRLDRWRRLN